MKRTVLAAIAATLIGGALGQDVEERFDFKGVKLGTPLAEVRAALNLACVTGKSPQFDTICTYKNKADSTYAGLPARDTLFGFFADRLDSVLVTLSGADYSAAKAATDSKFGPVDARYNIATYMMNGDRVYVHYLQGHETLVRYEAAAGNEERAKRADAAKAKRNKDM